MAHSMTQQPPTRPVPDGGNSSRRDGAIEKGTGSGFGSSPTSQRGNGNQRRNLPLHVAVSVVVPGCLALDRPWTGPGPGRDERHGRRWTLHAPSCCAIGGNADRGTPAP